MDILFKIKRAGLVGRGGAGFPVEKKWLAVKNAVGNKKYVVCNAAEGEPGVYKDGYILEHYPERVIDGMKIAIDFL
ncbi:MAG: iron hydrogenase, partial [bacterium]